MWYLESHAKQTKKKKKKVVGSIKIMKVKIKNIKITQLKKIKVYHIF